LLRPVGFIAGADGAVHRGAPRLFKAGPNIEGAWWLDPALALMGSDPALARFPMLEFSPRQRLDGPKDAGRAVGEHAHAPDVALCIMSRRG